MKKPIRTFFLAAMVAGALGAGASTGLAQGDGGPADTGGNSSSGNTNSDGFFNNLLSPFSSGTKTNVTNGQNAPDINEVRQEAYDGPKARIAVARFTDKTRKGWYSRAIGDGMADQLVTALFNTNKFIVLERQTLGDVLQEQDLGASGRVRKGTQARIGEIEGAELLVTAAVTEFEGAASGSRVSGGGGGVLGDVGRLIGSATAAFKRAHIAIDLRIVDTNTSRIVAATSVEGEATDVDMGAALFGASGRGGLGGALGAWQNTPTEKALRIVIARAVDFIASRTPAKFYRYGTAQQVVNRQAPQSTGGGGTSTAAQNAPAYQSGMTARVSSNRLNMRSGPSTGNPVVGALNRGTPLLILATSGKWVQVQSDTGASGWVASWLTVPDPGISAEIFEEDPEPAPVATSVQTPAPAATSSGAGTADIAGRLQRLKTLRDQGLISNEDYEAKKQEILKDL